MGTAPSQPQAQKLNQLFQINELIEQYSKEIASWNEPSLIDYIEQNISLRNQHIKNCECQNQCLPQQQLPDHTNNIKLEEELLKQSKLNLIKKTENLFDKLINHLYQQKAEIYFNFGYFDKIPISFDENKQLTKKYDSQGVCEYRAEGCTNLFSIEKIAVKPGKKYKLEIEYKNEQNCSDHPSYFGFESFYQNHPILSIQDIKYKGTEVKLIGLDENNKALIVDNQNNNLSRWKSSSQKYYEKHIGYYISGDINSFIKAEDIIVHRDNETHAFREVNLEHNKIYLTDWGWNQFMNLFQKSHLNQAVLMNHGEGATYDYCEYGKCYSQWTKRSFDITNFRKFTDSIKIIVLANLGCNENRVFEFRNVNWIVCRDEE